MCADLLRLITITINAMQTTEMTALPAITAIHIMGRAVEEEEDDEAEAVMLADTAKLAAWLAVADTADRLAVVNAQELEVFNEDAMRVATLVLAGEVDEDATERRLLALLNRGLVSKNTRDKQVVILG